MFYFSLSLLFLPRWSTVFLSNFLAGPPRSDPGGSAGAHQAFPPHIRVQHLPGKSAVHAWVRSLLWGQGLASANIRLRDFAKFVG